MDLISSGKLSPMRLLTSVFLLYFFIPCLAQNYPDLHQSIRQLYQKENNQNINKLWDELIAKTPIPITYEDSVIFLDKGEEK